VGPVTDSEWAVIEQLLAEGWNQAWDQRKADAYRLLLGGYEAGEVAMAVRRIIERGTAYRPSIAEVVAAINVDAGLPTWAETYQLIIAVCWDPGRLGEAHEVVRLFVQAQGLGRLQTLPLNDPDWGHVERKRLGDEYDRFVDRYQERRREGRALEARGPTWYARYRTPDGRQKQQVIGPAWLKRHRPPGDAYVTRAAAEARLAELLEAADRGELPGQESQYGTTFRDAAREYLRWVEQVKQVDYVTVKDYAGVVYGYLDAEFGDRPIRSITDEQVSAYAERLLAEGKLSNRTITRHLVTLHAIFKRAKVEPNPAAADRVQRPRVVYSGEYRAYEPEQVQLLAAHAENRQDAALYRVAAFTGLRQGELLGLRWGDVDFVTGLLHVRRNYTDRREKVPKGKKVRSVPMAPAVTDELARLKEARAAELAGDDGLVFCTSVGGHLDSWALRRRFYRAIERAGLPRLRFHDLRHTFGTQVVRELDPYTLQSLMGHQHYSTTQRYLWHKPRPQDAAAIARAFGGESEDKPAEKPLSERDVRGS
jgi:integrase